MNHPVASSRPTRGGSSILPELALVALVLTLAAARLYGAHWYATYKPTGMQLLEGWPSSWEAAHFLVHAPTFLADQPVQAGIAPVDYRTYVNLYLYTQLLGLTGSAYWSLAAVDTFFWVLATLCTVHLGQRLGLSRIASCVGGLLVAGSPVLVAFMWHQDLHLANMASLPVGLWAAVTLIQEQRSRVWLAAGLGCVLTYLSLTYQYQWFVAPAALIIAALNPTIGPRIAALVTGGAVMVFTALTLVIQGVLLLAGLGPTPERLSAVQQPLALLAAQVAEARDVRQLIALLPGPDQVVATATAYHPVIFVVGLIGLSAAGRRGLALGALTLVAPLLFMRLYPPPWVAMTGYPLICLGAGHACGQVGRGIASSALRTYRLARLRPWLSAGVAVAAGSGLFALTNGDLVGDVRFMLAWWNLYSAPPLH